MFALPEVDSAMDISHVKTSTQVLYSLSYIFLSNSSSSPGIKSWHCFVLITTTRSSLKIQNLTLRLNPQNEDQGQGFKWSLTLKTQILLNEVSPTGMVNQCGEGHRERNSKEEKEKDQSGHQTSGIFFWCRSIKVYSEAPSPEQLSWDGIEPSEDRIHHWISSVPDFCHGYLLILWREIHVNQTCKNTNGYRTISFPPFLLKYQVDKGCSLQKKIHLKILTKG